MTHRTLEFKLSYAEVDHVLACLKGRDEGQDAGWYYGAKDLFERRHKYLIALFETSFPAKPGEKHEP